MQRERFIGSPAQNTSVMSYNARRMEASMQSLNVIRDYPATILGPTTLKLISLMLDPEDPLGSDWEKLAELLEFGNLEIRKFKEGRYRAEAVIVSATRRFCLHMNDVIDLIHIQLNRRDVFTDDEVARSILSDAQRHDKSKTRSWGRSYSSPVRHPPPLFQTMMPEATMFHQLNTASLPPFYYPSSFDYMASVPYSNSDLYGPGVPQEPDSTTSLTRQTLGARGPPVENEAAQAKRPIQKTKKDLYVQDATIAHHYGRRGVSLPCGAVDWFPGRFLYNP